MGKGHEQHNIGNLIEAKVLIQGKGHVDSLISRLGNVLNILRDEGVVQPVVNGWNFVKSHGLRRSFSRLDVVGQVQSGSYAEWIIKYDTLTDVGLKNIAEEIAEFEKHPLISIVMPTYNTNLDWLKQAVDSVCAQLYPHWELCIADDCSSDSNVINYLKSLSGKDDRIKVAFRTENGHISNASNTALSLCTGEWIALLDHDDLLPTHALFWIAEAINEHSSVEFIYSDEDKINRHGHRDSPYFKTDWNRELFYGHNLICHLGVYKGSVVNDIGGFREGFEGAQDYDLALRYIEQIDQSNIVHIPRILYHWRVHAESTAGGIEAKPYAIQAGEKALREHFDRQGVDATVSSTEFGYDVRYAMPDEPPLVTLIIPTRNAWKLLKTCIDSIFDKTDYFNFEVIVINNGSDEPESINYLGQLNRHPKIRVISDDRPFNYSSLNNSAVEEARGSLVGLLNNDIEVITPGWLSDMVAVACRPDVGAVGAKLLYDDNTVQHCGVVIGVGGVAGHAFKHSAVDSPGYYNRAQVTSEFTAVTAACLLVQKDTFRAVGGLDEKNLTVAFNDVDFCLKVKEAGYRNVMVPKAVLYHHESVSRGYEDTPEKKKRFSAEVLHMEKKWGSKLLQDTGYSPNLSLNMENFDLAYPPRVKFFE